MRDFSEQVNTLVQLQADEAAAAERETLLNLILAGAAAVAVGLGLGLSLALSMARRLRTTMAAIQTVALGDLSQRLDVSLQDEIGELGQGVNKMQTNLAATAQVAEAIAHGDITGQPVLLSDFMVRHDGAVFGMAMDRFVAVVPLENLGVRPGEGGPSTGDKPFVEMVRAFRNNTLILLSAATIAALVKRNFDSQQLLTDGESAPAIRH